MSANGEDQILYLNCRACVDEKKKAGLIVLVHDGDLVITCANPEHGVIHMQPWIGEDLECYACAHGEDHDHTH